MAEKKDGNKKTKRVSKVENGVKVKPPTIKDVAREAGCSVSAVSFVLNGKGDSIPQRTKQKIFDAVKKLNYKPNYNARAMVTKKTNIIGIVLPDISNVFFAELVRHMQLELNTYGYDIILCNSEERADRDLRYIHFLSGRNVDGLILSPSAQSLEQENMQNYKNALEQAGVPFIFLDRYISGLAPKIAVDNAHSSYLAIKHFIQNGHKKIGIITGPLGLNSSRNRYKGVKLALEEEGISLPEEYVYVGKYDLESGRLGAEKLLKTDVSAIFAFSDIQAYGVIDYVKSQNLKIPDDISLIGFDDIFYSSLLDVPLTTMRQPTKELAVDACKTIVSMIESKGEGVVEERRNLIAQLIVRKSVKNLL